MIRFVAAKAAAETARLAAPVIGLVYTGLELEAALRTSGAPIPALTGASGLEPTGSGRGAHSSRRSEGSPGPPGKVAFDGAAVSRRCRGRLTPASNKMGEGLRAINGPEARATRVSSLARDGRVGRNRVGASLWRAILRHKMSCSIGRRLVKGRRLARGRRTGSGGAGWDLSGGVAAGRVAAGGETGREAGRVKVRGAGRGAVRAAGARGCVASTRRDGVRHGGTGGAGLTKDRPPISNLATLTQRAGFRRG